MADPVEQGAKGGLDFLKQKVGPLPLGVWLVLGLGIYLYLQRQQASSSSASAVPNQQTDPAGNIGTIDPATGYVYGTPEDTASLSANNAGTSSPSGSAGQSSTSGGQSYADNNSWGIAAVNYLVGIGVDAATANQAVQLYLTSQPLTTAQQGDVNLAILKLGPPPTLPGPVSSNPTPVTTPPGTGGGGGGRKSVGVPTGLVVTAKSNHSARIKWNKVTGATGYHLTATDTATRKASGQADVGAATVTYAFTNLTGGHGYTFNVWAEPESGAVGTGAHASVSATLPK